MAKAPAFQFYANDFMDATRFWDANACGLYIRCMCIQWTQGYIPSDLKLLARGLGCDLSELQSVWPVLSQKFVDIGGGQLQNQRLERVRQRQEEVSSKRSKAANARWDADANASPNGHAKSIQRKVKVKEKVEREEEREGEGEAGHAAATLWPTFDDFYNAYGKKRGRPDAERQWAKLPQKDREAVMAAIPHYIANTPKEFRKDPERYLSKRAWEDEVITRTTGTNGQPTHEEQMDALGRVLEERYGNRAANP